MNRLALLAALLACACVPRGAIQDGKDRDGDGYIAWQLGGDDCDDADAAANPGRSEVCGNGDDDDCDGITDDDGTGATQWYPDLDRDGYGVDSPISACTQPAAYLDRIDAGVDCDDSDDDTHPGAAEICGNDADDNCDGNTDDQGLGSPSWYPDLDEDGFATNDPVQACGRPTHYVSTLGVVDCDDNDGMINPDADEIWYDDVDQDCHEDDDFDQDGDGFASEAEASGGDCNDVNDAVNPDATEICFNVTDDDCDGHTDDTGLGAATWYPDLDQDGFATNNPVQACTQPLKHTSTLGAEDCNDFNSTVKPGAVEIWYDGADQDCAGDDDYDRDADGFDAEGEITGGNDCEDTVFAVNPDADEVCDNGLDDDCNTTANGCELLGTYAVTAVSSSTITQANASLGGFGGHLFITDATGDGVQDLIAAGYAGSVWVFKSPIGPNVDQNGRYAEFRSVSAPIWMDAAIGDFNGDGVPDMAIGSQEAQDARIFYGPLSGYFTRNDADVIITDPASGTKFGGSVAAFPDFDADGHDELCIGANSPTLTLPPAHYVFDGPYVNGWTTANRTGRLLGRLDFDGTGYLATTANLAPTGPRVLVASNGDEFYTGTIASFNPTALSGDRTVLDNAIVLGINANTLEASSVAAADFNNDGITDIVAGAPRMSSYKGAVYVVSGSFSTASPILMSQAYFTLLGTESNGQLGAQAGALDFDGDGILDLVVGATTANDRIRIFYGPLTPGTHGPDDADVKLSGVGFYQFAVGDLNSDGRDDLVLRSSGTILRIVLGHGR